MHSYTGNKWQDRYQQWGWYLILEIVDLQAEVTAMKEKLISFVNGIKEESASIYQNKSSKGNFLSW